MLPHETNEVCKAAFINLVISDSEYHGRTYCYFEPYESRKMNKHLTLVDKATGFGIVVPLKIEDIPYMDKDIVQRIISKTFGTLVKMAKMKQAEGKPVDYKTNPIKANGHMSRLEHIEKGANVTVEVYSWSRIIVK